MNPVDVRNYDGAIGVLFHKFVSKEDGLFIVTDSSTPENSSNSGYEKIDHRIYWYWISG